MRCSHGLHLGAELLSLSDTGAAGLRMGKGLVPSGRWLQPGTGRGIENPCLQVGLRKGGKGWSSLYRQHELPGDLQRGPSEKEGLEGK